MSERDGTAEGDADEPTRSETTVCASCGDVIDESEWYPIRGRTDGDGEFRLFSFCSEGCVDSWAGV